MSWPGGWGSQHPPVKKGLFGGVKWEDTTYPPYGGYGYQQPTPIPKVNNVPSYGHPLPNADGAVNPGTALPRTLPPTIHTGPPGKPLPANYWQLSKKMQKKIMKDQQKEAAVWKRAQEQQLKLYKESLKLKEKEMKEKKKAEEKERKKIEKAFLYAMKHPGHGAHPLPAVRPGMYSTPAEAQAAAAAAAAKAAAATATTAALGPGSKPKSTGRALQGPIDPLTHMMLPTGEEFGVRRPFDVDGLPSAMGGSSAWPMMSRTMTHALLDMSKEETVHMLNNKTLYKPDW